MKTCSFVGFGAWGGAMAAHLARHGVKPIWAWEYLDSIRESVRSERRHPHLGDTFRVPESIELLSRIEELPQNDAILFLAVSSTHLLSTTDRLKAVRGKSKPYACVLLSKGLDPESLNFFSALIPRRMAIPARDIFVLSGPTIAKELLAGAPTTAVLAGPAGSKIRALEALLSRGNLSVHTVSDAIGAQIGGSMKNIYAIGYGLLEALGAAANTRAFYLTQALDEMAQTAARLGGKKETIYGPAGLGDLLTTSLSTDSRNSKLGRMLAGGRALADIQKEISMTTEGVEACRAYLSLAQKKRLNLPLAQAIQKVLNGTLTGTGFMLGLNKGF